MADIFTKTGEYFMAYDENEEEQIISFKHKASDSTFDDGMTLEDKFGTIHSMILVDSKSIPDSSPDNQLIFVYEDV